MDERILVRAVSVKDSISIDRDITKCVDCGLCQRNCKEHEGIEDLKCGKLCMNCGQCIQVCPVDAMMPKSDIHKFRKALKEGKTCICYIAPGVRVSIGEAFGMEYGTFAEGRMVTALKKLGFEYVLDVTFGADLTIMEEATEFVQRIENNGKFPMFTSCCPAWVKYAETFYPEILDNLSTCKSPISMQGAIVQEYFKKKNKIQNDIFTVAITPCTAKKYEVAREELPGTDIVLTTRELADLMMEENLDLKDLEETKFDSFTGSGAGLIFGNTGGVMQAALRTAYFIMTGKDLDESKLIFNEISSFDNVKELAIEIEGIKLNIAVVHDMVNAIPLLEEVKEGKSKYHYIEVMNCQGGCIGGGGQIRIPRKDVIVGKQARIASIYEGDKKNKIRYSYKNEEILKLYKEYIGRPMNERAEKLLHTKFFDKSKRK